MTKINHRHAIRTQNVHKNWRCLCQMPNATTALPERGHTPDRCIHAQLSPLTRRVVGSAIDV